VVGGAELVDDGLERIVELDRLDPARGTMMSCTVTASMSKRLSTIAMCFFGMKVEDSSTRVRISSGESFGVSVRTRCGCAAPRAAAARRD
jgi:hypothetical protein